MDEEGKGTEWGYLFITSDIYNPTVMLVSYPYVKSSLSWLHKTSFLTESVKFLMQTYYFLHPCQVFTFFYINNNCTVEQWKNNQIITSNS